MDRLDKFTYRGILLSSVSSFGILAKKEQVEFKDLGETVYAKIQYGFKESHLKDKKTYEEFLSKLADYQEEVLKNSSINTADLIQEQTNTALKTIREEQNRLLELNTSMLKDIEEAMKDTGAFQKVVKTQLTSLNVVDPVVKIIKGFKADLSNIVKEVVKPLEDEIVVLKSTNNRYKQNILNFEEETSKLVNGIVIELDKVSKETKTLSEVVKNTEKQIQLVFNFES